MRTNNTELRRQLNNTLEKYKELEKSDSQSLQRISEKCRYELKLSQDQVKLLHSVFKSAKKCALLYEDMDMHIEYSILHEVVYNQVTKQTTF